MVFLLMRLGLSPLVVADVVLQVVSIVLDALAQQWLML